jgi:thymidylate synthase
MQVVMRSQNVYGVFPYDVYLFSVLQELIANSMDLSLGPLDWICLSAHTYHRDNEAVEKALEWYDVNGTHPEEDEPIRYDLNDAIDIYPQIYQELTPDISTDTTIQWRTDDPVLNGMLQGYKEITGAEAPVT